MFRLLFFSFSSVIFAQQNYPALPFLNDTHTINDSSKLQCNGLFLPREGPQERWKEVTEWVKQRAPSAFVDERIVMRPVRGEPAVATADMISKGEILLKLPVSTFLFEEDCFPTEAFAALGTNFSSSLKENLPRATWNTSKVNGADFVQAGLCLLIHRTLGKDSPFEGYVKHLPAQSSGETYMFQDFSAFDPLRGSEVFRMVTAIKQRHLASLHAAVDASLKTIQDYFPSYNWTREKLHHELKQTLSLCGSRTFNFDSDMLVTSRGRPPLVRPVLIPALDLLNHGDSRSQNCKYYFNFTEQTFRLQAIRDIIPGEELVQSYGQRTNADLLMFYGFLLPRGNTDDYTLVADLAAGAIEYNYQLRLERDVKCFAPFFRSVEGSGWPPKFQQIIPNASKDASSGLLRLGPLRPSVFHSFKSTLENKSTTNNFTQIFSELSANPREAELRIVGSDFVVKLLNNKSKSNYNESVIRGNLTVELMWGGSPRKCENEKKDGEKLWCDHFSSSVSSVSTVVNQLTQGMLPAVARAGGCLLYSDAKQQVYEIKMDHNREWVGVITTKYGAKRGSKVVIDKAKVLSDFQLKRKIIRAAGLEHYTANVYRTGVIPDTLAAVRIAVLPELSAFAIHSILNGKRFDDALEEQVAKTLSMFCFEELTRRLQVLGVETEEHSLLLLVQQSRSFTSDTEADGSYQALARNDLEIVSDFCTGIADWEIDIWQ